jgi:hypothetical protein
MRIKNAVGLLSALQIKRPELKWPEATEMSEEPDSPGALLRKCCSESAAHQLPRNNFQEWNFLKAVGRRLGQGCPGAVKPANLATGSSWHPRNVGFNELFALRRN